ncbi:putative B3 domain-containing protein Os06g0632500 isoform X1 [Carex rostrata]
MAPLKYPNANASPSLTKRPQFFRVLIPNPFVKLPIPQNFMKHLDGDRYNKATLLSPHGKFWHINLHQEGNDLYLDGGWSNFAKEHDLCTGDFVVFRYEGNMVFTVKVFDVTCCLKEYELASCKSPGCSSTSNESSEVESLTLNQSSEHEDEVQCNSTPSSKKRKSIEISRKRTASPATASIKKSKKTSSSSATPPIEKTKRITHVSSTPIKRIEKTTPSSPTPPIEKAHKNSPSLTSLPHFEKVVRPYSSNYMSFPKKFCNRHGLVSRKGITLKNLKGKSYDVLLFDRNTEVRVGKGWRDFTSENGLRDGDICIFTLVAKSTMLVCLKDVQGKLEAHKDSREEIACNSALVIQCPQFENIVRPFNLRLGYFTIPVSFCLENGLVSKRYVILEDSDGTKWQVRFLIRNERAKFQKGWSKFSKAHDLKVGKKCIFTLVGENTFRVIVEKKQAENDA